MITPRRRFSGCLGDRGAAALEFAVVIPIFLLVLLTMYDAGRIFFVKIALLNAASQGARAAAYGGGTVPLITGSQAVTVAVNAANNAGVAGMSKGGGATPVVSGAAAFFVDGVSDPMASCPAPGTTTVTVSMTVKVTSFNWLTPLALIQQFQPSNTTGANPWILQSTSQWLCE